MTEPEPKFELKTEAPPPARRPVMGYFAVGFGLLGVNLPKPVPVAYHSFRGWKRPLFGDHYVHGMEGVRFLTRLKTITARWPSGISTGAEFHFKPGAGNQ